MSRLKCWSTENEIRCKIVQTKKQVNVYFCFFDWLIVNGENEGFIFDNENGKYIRMDPVFQKRDDPIFIVWSAEKCTIILSVCVFNRDRMCVCGQNML